MSRPSASIQAAKHTEDEFDEKFIFKQAMNGEWDALVTAYKKMNFEQDAKINKAEDTILHMAVNTGNKINVKRLVERVRGVEVLKARNKKGNTPLHLAAALGYHDLCAVMIDREKTLMPGNHTDQYVRLIMSRNEGGETAFFRSVFHGRREVFQFFLNIIQKKHSEDEWRALCRRTDGDTILHCSIASEFFDLALAIVDCFPFLTNSYNVKGLTPLQVLANHPSVFQSGSRLNLRDTLIYFCTWVDPLVVGSLNKEFKRDEEDDTSNSCLPKNYEILEKLVTGIARIFSRTFSQKEQQSNINGLGLTQIPINNQGDKLEVQELVIGDGESSLGRNLKEASIRTAKIPILIHSEGDIMNRLPPNYMSFVFIIKHLLQIIMIPLGFVFGRFRRIKSQKEKHIWAAQVMKKLIANASSYEYESTGMVPTTSMFSMFENIETSETQSKQSHAVQQRNGKQKSVLHENTDTDDPMLGSSISKFELGEELPPKSVTGETQSKKSTEDEEKIEKQKKIEDSKETPILTAARLGIVEMVKMIADSKETPLLTEATPGMVELVKMIADFKETPILTAARLGIVEMVKMIAETFPVAIYDTDNEKKNIVHLAVENRQPLVYDYLLKKDIMSESIFQEVDEDGNSALHLAAKANDRLPRSIPGVVLQIIQWDIKWFKYIEDSKPKNFFAGFNQNGETPNEVFTKTHENLIEKGVEWLTNTSESCTVVAAFVATVAFASSVTVPGGVRQDNGFPVLEDKLPFKIFAAASLVALCLSVTSLVMFLAILTSLYEEKDFHTDLPLKFIIGLTSLNGSLAAILVAFCAGHFFVLQFEKLKYAALLLYAITCLPIISFLLSHFPLYLDLFKSTLTEVPTRSYV